MTGSSAVSRWCGFALLIQLLLTGQVLAGESVKKIFELTKDNLALRVGERRFLFADSVFAIHYAIIDRKSRLELAIAPSGAGGWSLDRFILSEKAIAAFNGGFLRTYTPATPTGLVRVGGEVNSPSLMKSEVLTGLICFAAGGDPRRIILEPIDASQHLAEKTIDCLQAGPVLIYKDGPYGDLERLDASLRNFSSVAAERSFIALDKRGAVIFGVTTKTSLYALRAALLQATEQGGFGITAAIGLTGRDTAGLIVAGKKKQNTYSAGSAFTVLPNAIIVKR